MKRFSAKAMRGRAGPFELVLEAADATEAANRLRVEGYTVLAVAPAAPAWLGRRSEKFPLVLFSQELAVLLEAGVPLTASLHALAEHGGRTPSTRVIEDIVRAVQEDRALSQALRAAIAAQVHGGEIGAFWRDAVADATAPTPEALGNFTLEPGPDGRATGLAFHYAPYAVASYADGAPVIVIDRAAFAAHLTPQGAALFGR